MTKLAKVLFTNVAMVTLLHWTLKIPILGDLIERT